MIAGFFAAVAVAAVCGGSDAWGGRPGHLAVVNPPVPTDDGRVLSLRGEWEFSAFRHAIEGRDLRYMHERNFWGEAPEGWKNLRKINVPGCWEAQGVGEPGPGISYQGRPVATWTHKHVHVGNGFYRKRVSIPGSWRGQRIWLKVGRVQSRGWFWVDGKPVAHVNEAHRALKWEITDLVRPGAECTVLAEVDNTYPFRNSQIYTYNRWGGLIRDVELEATPGVFMDEVWVRGDFDRQVAEAHVEVGGEVKVKGEGEQRTDSFFLRATIEGEAKEITLHRSPSPSTFTLEIPLGNFRPWSPEYPNLYTAKVELVSAEGKVLQRVYERFGVRKLEVRGKEFYLNGRPFFFRGFGDDSTYPITGMSPASKEFHLAHLRTARAAGFNFVRTHTHYELPEYFDAADEAGVFVQPELSYNCDESSEEVFDYDPLRDLRAAWQGYRRHPAFAVYSGGNEGTHREAGKAIFDWVHANDPDRLVLEQDGGTYFEGHRADKSDYASGPMSMWERGSFNPRAFVCHEYANLCVKGDARMEGDYTGVWEPRMTRAMRRTNLAPAGLGEAWGDRLQDAQHDLQRFWARRSVEAARKDPFCDGYIFWTIVDFMHFSKEANAPQAQGLLDPFWRAKPHGTTPESFAEVNSPTAILLDTEDRERVYREDTDPMLCCGSLRKLVIDETNRVYAVGETIPAEFILAHYGEDLADAKLVWNLAANGATLASGEKAIGFQQPGPARTVGKFPIVVPEVARPTKATLTATVTGQSNNRTIEQSNNWIFWLFPKTSAPSVPANVVVADFGSVEAESARKAGKGLVLVGNRRGERDIFLGWWALGWRNHANWTQNGVAAVPHLVWGDFPYEPFLSPLVFGLIGQGTPLPVAGFEEKDFVMVGEGNSDFKLYLAAKTRPDGGREVFVSGLDVFSGSVEANRLYANILRWVKESRSVCDPGAVRAGCGAQRHGDPDAR